MAKKLAITLKKSPVGRPENQRKTAVALGLTRLQQTVVRTDTPVIRGMINRISHLVEVVEQEA
ncbi:50S ribosomal protein L30 [Alicyclobacillus acidoterrestris]|uniref:Large ribosomal subunit protein uL30 n=1 Tax=Alicyclobacillus acidoterrestris (strain ATCC 49025 / DSM 3922 / CIP 106132 / NCIMB 13137 / GD3B) TaxID=1356854 RepID=T0BZU2_ALIAG|nr:50S ribosomal protein L30 [Alicyclobacillus acidoterrestris]EPZ45925.1 50S ribosomal protein L30 [Alicyclobacillus acidoterrestris ATCC 49025]UNO49310.1 50S ribosomal protein L30 [Alicyclobacillus acidoterrestris]